MDMSEFITVTDVRIIVAKEHIAELIPLILARIEHDENYLRRKERYQGLLYVLAPDELFLWLLATTGWRASVRPNGEVLLFGYNDFLLDPDSDPFLACSQEFVEEGSYVEGWSYKNFKLQVLYTEKGKVKRTADVVFPHYRPTHPNGTQLDIVTERSFWLSAEQVALWYLKLSEAEQIEALQNYQDKGDLSQRVCHAVSDAMIPNAFQEYVALLQVMPDVWNTSHPDTLMEDDEDLTPERVFGLTLKRLVFEYLQEQWQSFELEAKQTG